MIAGIFIFIGGTIFGATLNLVGLLIHFFHKKNIGKKIKASKVQPSPGVVYEEINSAVGTSLNPIELQDNAAYGRI